MPIPDRPATQPHTNEGEEHEMTRTSPPQGAKDDTPSAKRRLTSRIPIWVRVSMITAAVLVGVLLSTMLLAAGSGDRGDSGVGHGRRGEMELNSDSSGGEHGSGSDHGAGSDHSG